MLKKISAVILTLLMILSVFAACTKQQTATQSSDADSAKIKDHFAHLTSQHTLAQSAKEFTSVMVFENAISSPGTAAVSYTGEEEIKIKADKTISKLVAVNTTGNVSLDTDTESVIVYGAAEKITINAFTESFIVSADNVTADIKNQLGIMYVEGQDVTVNVKDHNIDMIFARNTAVTVNNKTNKDISVMLVNGAKVTVPGDSTYSVKDNTIT